MTLQGVDYSGGGPLTAAQCRGGGISFVCRYVSDRATAWNIAKTVRQSEVDDFRAGGIGIVIVFEGNPKDALGGYEAGIANARRGDELIRGRGIDGCPLYMAIDFDIQPYQYPIADAYLTGGASVVGYDRLGVYGKNAYLTHVLDGGIARYAWATPAWEGVLDPRAHLFQYGGGTVAGVSVDWNRTVSSDADYGQFGGVAVVPGFDLIRWISDPNYA